MVAECVHIRDPEDVYWKTAHIFSRSGNESGIATLFLIAFEQLNLQSVQESSREQTAEQRSCSIVNSFVPQHFDNFWEQRRQNGFSNQRSGPRLGRIRLG